MAMTHIKNGKLCLNQALNWQTDSFSEVKGN